MRIRRNDRSGEWTPAMIAVVVAVLGQAVILFNDFGPGVNSHGSRSAGMITAAAVTKAGAIEIPSQPPAASRQVPS
jgi:hypothetical protein